MASYLLRNLLQKQGMGNQIAVESAGLSAFSGDPISENARLALKERGIDGFEHRAKPLSAYAVEQADRIYVMTHAHKEAIQKAIPEVKYRIRVLGVADPYGMDITAYRDCLDEIERFFEAELPHILSEKEERSGL